MNLSPDQKQKLKSMLAGGGDVAGSEMCFMNIEEYKQKLGDDWERYREILFSMTRNIISENVDPADIVLRTNNGFAVLFTGENNADISNLSQEISSKITDAIQMNDEFNAPPISCDAKAIDSQSFAQLMQAASAQDPTEQAAQSPQGQTKRPQKQPPKAPPKRPRSKADAAMEDVASGVDLSDVLRDLNFVEEFDPVILINRDFCYRPLWSARHKTIVASSFKRRRAYVEIGNIHENQYYRSDDKTFAVDITAFNKCVLDLVEMRKRGGMCQIMFPVNYNNFARPKYQKMYGSVFANLPAEVRKLFVPRLERISVGTPTSSIGSVATALKNYFERVIVEAPFQLENLENFSFAKSFAIELVPPPQKRSATDTTERTLKSFVSKVHSLGSKVVLDGLDNKEIFWAAMNVEADFLSGPVVGGYSLLPKPAQPLSIDKILNTANDGAAA